MKTVHVGLSDINKFKISRVRLEEGDRDSHQRKIKMAQSTLSVPIDKLNQEVVTQ